MKVNNTDNTVFTSRNKTIRYADDVARRAHGLYNTISTSKIACYKNFNKYEYLKTLILIETMLMRKMKDKLYNNAYSFYRKIEALINPIKLYKIANCGEKAHITCIMAKTNGMKDCHITHLYKSNGEDLDHAVIFVNDKKPYIIDGWLGFADYVPNTIKRYEKEFSQFFDIENGDTLVFASKYDDEYTDLLKYDFSKKQRKKIKELYPEMNIK